MKKLNAQEGKDYIPVTHGRTSRIRAEITILQVNEVLIITRADWKSQRNSVSNGKTDRKETPLKVYKRPHPRWHRLGC